MDPIENELKELLSGGKVVPFIGAGIPSAVVGAPGWWTLLEQGFKYVEDRHLCTVDELKGGRDLLNANKLTAAADILQEMLGAPTGEYPAWLKANFEYRPTDLKHPAVLERIHDLLCPLIVTTNYDRLISFVFPSSWRTFTWDQSIPMLTGMRDEQALLHLHGIYDQPKSVVLGKKTYERLIRREAYRELVKTLWLQRTLLFIGCSDDGLHDPDFTRFFAWAARVFKGNPYKHYWLTKTGVVPFDKRARGLLEDRVQVIEYGSSHDDLPHCLARLCPDREKAREERAKLVQQSLGTSDGNAIFERVQFLRSTLSRLDTTTPSAGTSLESARMIRLRRELSDLQALLRDVVDESALRKLAKESPREYPFGKPLPNEDLAAKKDRHRTLRTAARAASAAIFLIPDEILGALDRREVHIHSAVLSGFAKDLINTSRPLSDFDDGYVQQNMFRVIDGLLGVLDADPRSVFTDPVPGVSRTDVREGLVIARTGKLQLLSASEPWGMLAELPVTPTVRCGVTWALDARQIIAHTEESLFLWDPRLPDGITLLRDLPLAIGICNAVHRKIEGSLLSVMNTYDGNILMCKDFAPPAVVWNSGDMPLLDVALTADGRILALDGHDIVEVRPGYGLRVILTAKQLIEAIHQHPDCPAVGEFFLNNSSLGTSKIQGQDVTSLLTQLRNRSGQPCGTAILFWDSTTWNEAGIFAIRTGTAMNFAIGPGLHGRVRLWVSLISSRQSSDQDLIIWSDGIATRNGLMFRRNGSLGRHPHDLTHILAVDENHGFVSDGEGSILAFSTDAGNLVEVSAPDLNSTLWSMERFDDT